MPHSTLNTCFTWLCGQQGLEAEPSAQRKLVQHLQIPNSCLVGVMMWMVKMLHCTVWLMLLLLLQLYPVSCLDLQ